MLMWNIVEHLLYHFDWKKSASFHISPPTKRVQTNKTVQTY